MMNLLDECDNKLAVCDPTRGLEIFNTVDPMPALSVRLALTQRLCTDSIK